MRSGVLTSVHSFANDPARGTFILILLAAITGGSLVLYAIRAPSLKGGGLFAPISREGGLLFNNVVLSTAAGTVLLGTLYPLFADALGLGKVSVGPPYFNIVIGAADGAADHRHGHRSASVMEARQSARGAVAG